MAVVSGLSSIGMARLSPGCITTCVLPSKSGPSAAPDGAAGSGFPDAGAPPDAAPQNGAAIEGAAAEEEEDGLGALLGRLENLGGTPPTPETGPSGLRGTQDGEPAEGEGASGLY
mgnify:CR=1 FL=1